MQGLERWRGRVALVTGASSGIGEALARSLAEHGMKVAVMARRRERLESLVASTEGEMRWWSGDVDNDAEVDTMFAELRREWGGLDLLVNNAGVGTMSQVVDGSPDTWRQTLTVNVAAPARFMQEALRDMESKDEGQIINISSIYAHRNQVPNFSFYQASKFALRALTDTLRGELFAKGTKVRVGMISPGMVATEFRERATDGAFTYESYFEQFEPLLPEHIVEAALYMLSTPPHVQVQDILLAPMGQGL